jgi:predicted PurR-regulated permease PerM
MPRYRTIPGPRSNQPRRLHHRLALGLTLALGLAILAALVAFRAILLPFVIAGILAFVFEPLVTRMAAYRVHRVVGVLVIYLALGLGILLFAQFLTPVIKAESGRVAGAAKVILGSTPAMYNRLEQRVADLIETLGGAEIPLLIPDVTTGPHVIFPAGTEAAAQPAPVPAPKPKATPAHKPGTATADPEVAPTEDGSPGHLDLKDKAVEALRSGVSRLGASLLSSFIKLFQEFLAGLFSALLGLLVIFMVTLYLLVDAPRLKTRVRAQVPRALQPHYDELLQRLDAGLSGAIRGQLLICLVNGLLSLVGFLIFIPDYAVVLAAFAAVLSLIPIFGTILSSIPVILIGLTIDLGTALGLTLWILGIHFLEANLLNPKIIGTQAKIHPVLVILVLIAGEKFYGIKGALLAVPAMSVIQALVQFTWARVKPELHRRWS